MANDLIAAEREHKAIGQFSDAHPDFDLATAYRAQRLFVAAKLEAGERFVGWKLGLTSRNKQQAMGVDAPLYGRVTSGMLATYGDPVRLDRFIHPRVESEIAFLLARDVEAPATVTSVLAATDVVFGAVDVLDSRYEGFRFTLEDVVADNASAGAFYLGPVARRPADLVRPAAARLRRAGGRRGGDDGGRCGRDGPPGGVGGVAGQPARRRGRGAARRASWCSPAA